MFDFLNQLDELSDQNLTIREQVRTAENPLDLRYRAIFPRTPAPSIKLSEITTVDFRPNAGRREWNAQPREIPEKLGPSREFELVPLGASHHIDERAMHKLQESGVQELIRRGIIGAVSTWPSRLADAIERQLEAEAFESWYTGVITVMDPKTGTTVEVDLGFDTDSYPTAGTAWDDPGEDAYNNLLAAIQAAQTKFGVVRAGRTRRNVVSAIVADAPDGPNGLRPSIASLEQRVREEGFPEFSLIIDERTYDRFNDGGSAHTATNYVPAGLIAFQPASGQVGRTHVAPVVRAYDYLSAGNRALANGVAIFKTPLNDGKTLKIEAQENSIVLPEEQFTYVVDTGIA